MSDQLNNVQNQYLQQLLAYEQAKMQQLNKEQEERRKKEAELQAKKTNDDLIAAKQKKEAAEKLQKAKLERDALVNAYINGNQHLDEDDGIDGRMVRQIISHGRKAKDSITYRVNVNKNFGGRKNQAQQDELYEQSQKQWWEQSET